MKPRRWSLALFYPLLLTVIALTALLSQRFDRAIDLTDANSQQLTAASERLLKRLKTPLKIISYAPANTALRKRIRAVITPYLNASKQVHFSFVNPDADPQRARAAGIHAHGELVLSYSGRDMHLTDLDEPHISRAITALLHAEQPWLVALSGHGERLFGGNANPGLSHVGAKLKQAGLRIADLDSREIQAIPDNTGVLIIADPREIYPPRARKLMKRHLQRGGNLLVLDDQRNSSRPAGFLLESLGLTPVPGWLYDPAPPMKLPAETMLAIEPNPGHATTRELELPLLFVDAGAYTARDDDDWRRDRLLTGDAETWAELEPPGNAKPVFDLLAGDTPGPLTLAWALSREINGRHQRVVVIGDADFAVNRFVGNGDNVAFFINTIRWLLHDDWLGGDAFEAADHGLRLSERQTLLIGFGFLFGLPLLLLGAGLSIHWLRRRQ